MAKIKELTTLLTNQIAAGEVVERPSSVVKELIENAIDAKSTRIEIQIEESGLKRITIIDNGEGMDEEDVLLSFKRHTTSKLYTPEQLFRIKTLGFRGEALASITAVSHTTITSSTGETFGTKVFLKGGELISVEKTAPIQGTTISVEQLFFNTPARLKYVKTLQTELAHITDIITKLALSHPEVAFIFKNDQTELLRTNGSGDLRQAIAGNLGTNNARKMIPFQIETMDLNISGYTSLPELTRSNRNYFYIFINGRSIKNYAIQRAIMNGYRSTLMVGRFPIAVINIEMDFLLVDVNVHPTKQEVRISKEKELAIAIEQAVWQAIQIQQRIPAVDLAGKVQKNQSVYEQQTLDLISRVNKEVNSLQNAIPLNLPTEDKPIVQPNTSSTYSHSPFLKVEDERITFEVPVEEHPNEAAEGFTEPLSIIEEDKVDIMSRNSSFPNLYYFGQMHGTYLFAQNENGFYMIDQHAAQERIKYEQYKVDIGKVSNTLQPLLVPIIMEFAPHEFLLLKEKERILSSLGIVLEEFGKNSFQIQAHPQWIKRGEEVETIEYMLDMILKNRSIEVEKIREDTAIMMSCKHSIKANHRLTDDQARKLLEDLSTCQNPYNCPHGRPVLIHFSNKDIEKLFKRIQDSHESQPHQ